MFQWPLSSARGALCLAVALCALATPGCGGSSDDDFYDITASSTVSLSTSSSVAPPPGTVIYNTSVSGARLITGDQLRFSGYDAALELVYGPITVTGTGSQRLENLPASLSKLQVESLREGRVVSLRSYDVKFDASGLATLP